nr:MAG TPA: hypothetical protein [Caudoviricetes sp.]
MAASASPASAARRWRRGRRATARSWLWERLAPQARWAWALPPMTGSSSVWAWPRQPAKGRAGAAAARMDRRAGMPG